MLFYPTIWTPWQICAILLVPSLLFLSPQRSSYLVQNSKMISARFTLILNLHGMSPHLAAHSNCTFQHLFTHPLRHTHAPALLPTYSRPALPYRTLSCPALSCLALKTMRFESSLSKALLAADHVHHATSVVSESSPHLAAPVAAIARCRVLCGRAHIVKASSRAMFHPSSSFPRPRMVHLTSST